VPYWCSLVLVDSTVVEQPEFDRARPVFRRLGMSDRAGYKAVREGRFPLEPVMIGGVMKFRRAEVDRLCAGSTWSERS
jgi:predicted DNA-binding transcriptional regulator AlpA